MAVVRNASFTSYFWTLIENLLCLKLLGRHMNSMALRSEMITFYNWNIMWTTLQITTCCPGASLVFCPSGKCNRSSVSAWRQTRQPSSALVQKPTLHTNEHGLCLLTAEKDKVPACRLWLDNRGDHPTCMSSRSGSHSFALTGLRIGRESLLTLFASTELSAEVLALCIGVTNCLLRYKNQNAYSALE